MAAPRRTDEQVRFGADTRPAEKGLKRFLTSAKAQFAVFAGVAGGVMGGLTKGLVSLYRTQEQAEIRLRRAIIATGRYSADFERQMIDISDRVQRLTTVGDEVTQGIIARLIQIGKVGRDEIEEAVMGIIGLSRVYGKSVERMSRTVTNALAQTRNETTESLDTMERLLPEHAQYLRNVKASEGGAQAAKEAIRLLNREFGDQATIVKGTSEELEQTENRWYDFGEVVGRVLSNVLIPFNRALKDTSDEAGRMVEAGWITRMTRMFDVLSVHVKGLALRFLLLKEEYNSLMDGLLDAPRRWLGWTDEQIDDRIEAREIRIKALREEVEGLDADLERARAGASRIPETPGLKGRLGGLDDTETKDVKSLKEIELERAEAERLKREEALRDARIANARRETELLEMELAERAEIERRYFADIYELENEAAVARAQLSNDASQAELELILRNIELKRAARTAEYNRDKEEARRQAEAAHAERVNEFTEELSQWWEYSARKREAMAIQAELERELGFQFNAAEIEALIAHIQTREQIEADYRQRRILAELEARAEQDRIEQTYGKRGAATIGFWNSQKVKDTQSYFQSIAKLQTVGSKKVQAIAKAAAIADLLIANARAVAEAYASAAKYGPFAGPALGTAWAAAITSVIAGSLSLLGGSGAGGAGGAGGGPGAVEPPTGGIAAPAETAGGPTAIHLNVELDGRTLAEVVEDINLHSDRG